jgi:type I restriction enzyme S subunit
MNRMNEEQELPHGWELVKLKQVVATDGVFIDGDWVESKDQDPEGDIRLIQLADVGDGNYRNRSNRFMTLKKATKLNCTFLQEGDVLVARMPDPLGRACIFPGDVKKAVTVVDVCIIRTGKSGVDHRWLMNTLNSSVVRASIAALQSGSTRLRISRKNLETIEFPLPPLPEQRRIVAKLEELFSKLDAGVAAVRHTQALLKRYRQSVLHAAVTGELTRAWRETHLTAPAETGAALLQRIRAERRAQWEAAQMAKRGGQLPLGEGWKSKYVEPEAVEVALLPELPEGWVWASLEQLIMDGPQNGLYLPSTLYGSGNPIVRIDDYQSDWSRSSDSLRLVKCSEDEAKKYGLRVNDIVVNRVNSMSHIGKSFVVEERHIPAIFESNMMRLSVSSHVSPVFVNLYLRSKTGRDELIANAKQAVNQASINQNDVNSTAVPLPPLAEQAEIVAEVERRLTVLEALSQTLTAELKRAERLRQSLLHRAFTGRLVPQDATDEPAAALLARLRDAAAAPAKGRKTKEAATAAPKEKKPKGRKATDISQIDFSFLND